MVWVYYHAPDDNTLQLFTLAPNLSFHTHIQIIMRGLMEEEVEAGEGGRGLCPLNLQDLPRFRMANGCWGVGGSCGGTGSGHDPPLLLLLRERFPKEPRAETLDNSRCFPGAYRRRGPSGFVSCGCSCLRAKWTTVDLTLDLSSLSLPFSSCPFISRCTNSLLSCSIIPFTVSYFPSASVSPFFEFLPCLSLVLSKFENYLLFFFWPFECAVFFLWTGKCSLREKLCRKPAKMQLGDTVIILRGLASCHL